MRENLAGRPSRRSDQIRQRRQKTSPTSNNAKGLRSAKSVTRTPPPVMVRGSVGSIALEKSGQSRRNRRAVYVPLRSPGAEMRLPSLPNVRIGWRMVSFLIILMLGFSIYGLWTSPLFLVDIAEVEGLQNITSRDVNNALGLTGMSIFMLDSQEIEKELMDSFPEFSHVNVKIDLPDSVHIGVTERVPVLVWRMDGQAELVDQDGMAFRARNDSYNFDQYPVIESDQAPPLLETQVDLASSPEKAALGTVEPVAGELPSSANHAKPLLPSEMVSAILKMSKHLPEEATIFYDGARGFSWVDNRGWKIEFGDINEIEMKLLIYQSIFQHLKSNNTKPELISVESVHAPYYRLEQQ